MEASKTIALLVATALAEIVSCYPPYLWLKRHGSAWLLVPTGTSLALFAWLLTLHPTAAGRVYAAYGGLYIGVAILWLWIVDEVTPSTSDLAGAVVCFVGMAHHHVRAETWRLVANPTNRRIVDDRLLQQLAGLCLSLNRLGAASHDELSVLQ